jgi:hypothetical protein
LRKYVGDELKQFLLEIDRELETPVDIIVIGGAAMALAHRSTRATKDIDLWSTTALPGSFRSAVERVRIRTGIRIPIGETPEAEPPEAFEDRIKPYPLEGATTLRVFVPERHDLVMMKAARGEAADLDAILDMHRDQPLDLRILVERFAEMVPVGPPERFRLRFLSMVAAVFGESAADEIEKRLPGASIRST